MAMQLERVERLNLTLSAGAVAATFALASPHVASSLAVGAALEAMNFGALVRGARIYLGGGEQGSGPWLALFSVRFILLGAGIVLAMQAGAHPVGLLCGLSIAIPTVIIDGWLNRPPIDAAARGEGEWSVPPPEDESWDRYSIWRPQAVDEPEPVDEALATGMQRAANEDSSFLAGAEATNDEARKRRDSDASKASREARKATKPE
jgi:hypothetical protein